MYRKKIVITGIIALSILLTSCSREDKIFESVSETVEILFNMPGEKIESVLTQTAPIQLNLLEECKAVFVIEAMKKVSIIDKNKESDTKFIFTLKIPSMSEIEKLMISDIDGFMSDYKKLQSVKSKEEAIDNYVFSYATMLLNGTNVPMDSMEIQVEANGTHIATDDFIVDLIDKLGDYSFHFADATSNMHKGAQFKKIKVATSVACKVSGASLLITPTLLLRDDEALQKLHEISKLNRNVVLSENVSLAYLEYRVSNYSNKDLTVKNAFTAIDENGFIQKTVGVKVIGLADEAVVKANETANFTCILIGKKGFQCIWSLPKSTNNFTVVD